MQLAQKGSLVFVVDDDDAVRESLQVLLETAGYAAQAYSSGIEFLAASDREGKKGCVLLDAQMPHMNGLTVLKKLQTVRADLPVIMITGSGDAATAEEAIEAGAVDFIEKPILEELLLKSLDGALALIGDEHSEIC